MDTIYIPIHQLPISAVEDNADWLIEHRKLTLPLRPWKIVYPSKGATVYDLTPLTVLDKKGRMVTAQNENRTVTRNSSEKSLDPSAINRGNDASHSGYSSHADIGHQQELPVIITCPRVDAPDPSSLKRVSSPRVQADPTSRSNPTAESQARASHPFGQQPLSRSSTERRFSARFSTCGPKVL